MIKFADDAFAERFPVAATGILKGAPVRCAEDLKIGLKEVMSVIVLVSYFWGQLLLRL